MTGSSIALTESRKLSDLLSVLDDRERRYVEARVQGTPPVAAARVAGLDDPNDAPRTYERRSDIKEAMRCLNRSNLHRVRIVRDDVINGMLDAVAMAATASELVQAWREIGRIIGAYEPVKVDHTVTQRKQLESMSDQQLAELAAIDGEYQILAFSDEEHAKKD